MPHREPRPRTTATPGWRWILLAGLLLCVNWLVSDALLTPAPPRPVSTPG